MTLSDVTGVVLAGGKSSRMGTDKALLPFNGKPLIQHAVDKLQQICTQVVISAGNDRYRFTGCEHWPDILSGNAPMVGIYTCLKRTATPWIMVLSCDMPLVDPQLIPVLLNNRTSGDIVMPVHDDSCFEPLCAAYHINLIAALEVYISQGHLSLIKFAQQSNVKYLPVTEEMNFYKNNMFMNVNTFRDFDLLNKT